jgi:hypothetical protein
MTSAKVLHMAQDMTFTVLRHWLAEIGANADKGRCGLLDRIALNRNAADDHEASTPQQNVVADRQKTLPEPRQFKVVAINGNMIDAPVYDCLCRSVELRNLGISQSVSEITGVSKIQALPSGRSLDRFHRH